MITWIVVGLLGAIFLALLQIIRELEEIRKWSIQIRDALVNADGETAASLHHKLGMVLEYVSSIDRHVDPVDHHAAYEAGMEKLRENVKKAKSDGEID